MGIVSANKTVHPERIDCDGDFQVRLALAARPSILEAATDVALVLDVSGSMAGSALAEMKKGAKAFIDVLNGATGGKMNEKMGADSHIGIISFAETAQQRTPLTQDTALLKNAVDALTARGNTNHGDALQKAAALLATSRNSKRVIVLFTDGQTTSGPVPAPIAAALREAGILIYCIGLMGADGIDESILKEWAIKPSEEYVAITPDPAELAELFEHVAACISRPGARDIQILETVESDFEIVSAAAPSHGNVHVTGPRTLRWEIAVLAAVRPETAELVFTVRHVGHASGMKKVNHSILYSDKEGNKVVFPSPEVQVECDTGVCVEECPDPVECRAEGCQSEVLADVGPVKVTGTGCFLEVHLTLKGVCPGRKVALGVLLTEKDNHGKEHPCGVKTLVVPPHHGEVCKDIRLECLRFVIPSNEWSERPCEQRRFEVRALANYMDFKFECINFEKPCPCMEEAKKEE